MKCQFLLRNVPEGMLALFQGDASSRTRSAVLRHLATIGAEEVEDGADIRLATVRLCSGSGAPGTFAARVSDGSMLGETIDRLEKQLAMGQGNVFLLLAILGWEQSHHPKAFAQTGAPPVAVSPQAPLFPVAQPTRIPAQGGSPRSEVSASFGAASAPATIHHPVDTRQTQPVADALDGGVTADDEMAALGDKLLAQYEF